MDLALLEGHAVAMLLHIVRAGAFLAVVPLFGRQRDTFFLRLILSLALGSILWWSHIGPVAVPRDLIGLCIAVGGECLIGFALGYALSLLTALLVSAGEIISVEMGFTMARAMNPESGVDATVVSQLFQVFGFLLILEFDIHHEALRILAATYDACPVGGGVDVGPIWAGVRTLVSSTILFAVQYAFPVLSVMMLLTLGLVLFGRAVPHVNLMEFSFIARVLTALGAASYFMSSGTPFLQGAFADILVGVRAMFPG
ncbi:MAG: flagellar biosynthetic protein FliR [Planctomycetota bacterium]